jgi:hypothetical protein
MSSAPRPRARRRRTPPADRPDGQLAALLAHLAEHDLALDLTLLVAGALISGTPVSAAQYLAVLRAQLAEDQGAPRPPAAHAPAAWPQAAAGGAGDDPHAALLRQLEATGAGREAHAPLLRRLLAGEAASAARSGRRGPEYIHLMHVVIVGVGAGPLSVPLWRGRLDAVAGWTLGRLPQPRGQR